MAAPEEILKHYWGYPSFRPLQRDIIEAVLNGKDALALLPTGGGKSICYQVPALAMEGLCLVISPLIALMKDQVAQLKKRGISAVAINSGMSKRAVDIALDNCVYGKVKLLYVSPERLQSELFKARLARMQVNLLAVDEAHCISQWGYDFRPQYLQIEEIRQELPEIPCLALTATATPQVQEDIKEKLGFGAEGKHFQQSFARSNLAYVVREAEDKEAKLLEVMKGVRGSAIIYAPTRKKTKQLAMLLSKNGIKADFYHAGLTHEERQQKQDVWTKSEMGVMVATNAFGMGIDKPNVRLVVHLDIPQSLEAYYQEAGRAGRDEKKAYAVIVFHHADILQAREKLERTHPHEKDLKKIYQALGNYYQLAVGSGLNEQFPFDIVEFCHQFNFNSLEVYGQLKKLQEEGLIELNESFYNPSQLQFQLNHADLYKFEVANKTFDPIIKILLRLYGGELYNTLISISEKKIGEQLGITENEVVRTLDQLKSRDIILYEKKADGPQLIFTTERQNAERLQLNVERLKTLAKRADEKLEAVIDYVTHKKRCRTRLLLAYFGEMSDENCGICDICVEQKRRRTAVEQHDYHEQILHSVQEHPLLIEELVDHLNPQDKELLMETIRQMIDAGELKYNDKWQLLLA